MLLGVICELDIIGQKDKMYSVNPNVQLCSKCHTKSLKKDFHFIPRTSELAQTPSKDIPDS